MRVELRYRQPDEVWLLTIPPLRNTMRTLTVQGDALASCGQMVIRTFAGPSSA